MRWRRRRCGSAGPRRCACRSRGATGPGVTPKDMVLHLIGRLGGGGRHRVRGGICRPGGCAHCRWEGRLTLCNLSIELGAKMGFIAPDDATFDYLRGRHYAPQGAAFDAAIAQWRRLPSDPGAVFDREVVIDAADIAPTITWGHQSGACDRDWRVRPQPGERAGRRAADGVAQRVGLYGAGTRPPDRWDEGGLGVRRIVHERPHVRSARRRCHRSRPACRTWRHRLGGTRVPARQARG